MSAATTTVVVGTPSAAVQQIEMLQLLRKTPHVLCVVVEEQDESEAVAAAEAVHQAVQVCCHGEQWLQSRDSAQGSYASCVRSGIWTMSFNLSFAEL
eukprot:scaffold157801_cov21-Tisochrysis_lutea.AAC.1